MASIQFCGVSKVYRGGARTALPAPTGAGLSRNEVSTSLHEVRAVDGLDLEVRSGELLVLMGPSGSGKTTLLRMITGLDEPTTGSVLIDGRDQRGIATRSRNIAMVFQGLGLYGHLTARENLAFGLRVRSRGSAFNRWWGRRTQSEIDAEQAVTRVAQLLGISALLDKRPGELSGGEQQRVAIGRALVRQPDVLLLDEPLASLDGPTRFALRREIKRLQQLLGVTTVYVTHDQGEALALGDRIAVLHLGRLQQVGRPKEVYCQPANRLVASLFGDLGMSFVTGSIERSGSITEWVCGRWRLPLPEAIRKVVLSNGLNRLDLGVRPEDVKAVQPETEAAGLARWSGTVEVVEYQGTADFVHVSEDKVGQGGQPASVLAKQTAGQLKEGDTVSLQLDIEKVCWFDSDSGTNLGIKSAG